MIAFRSKTNPSLSLKLVVIENKEALKSDLVEIRIGNRNLQYMNTESIDDALATIGVYTDPGILLHFSLILSLVLALLMYCRRCQLRRFGARGGAGKPTLLSLKN
jgi:hypothetical protein